MCSASSFARIEFEVLRVDRDGDVVHPADRLAGCRHRVLGKVEEGQQVSVADVEEEVRRARQIPVLEELDQGEPEDLRVELDGALDVGADQGKVVHAAS